MEESESANKRGVQDPRRNRTSKGQIGSYVKNWYLVMECTFAKIVLIGTLTELVLKLDLCTCCTLGSKGEDE